MFAVVPTVTPNLGSSGTFFQQQKVPFFGWGIATGFCNNTYAFGFTGCIVPPPPVKLAGNTWGKLLDTEFKADGKGGAKGKTAAVVAEDSDGGKIGNKVIAGAGEVRA